MASVFLHRARLLEAALEDGDVEFARCIARVHSRQLEAALSGSAADAGLPSVDGPRADGRTPTFSVVLAGAYEGAFGIVVNVNAGTAENEQRLWAWLLHHPVVGEPLRALLTAASWADAET